jgi:hypothetical protein
MADSTIVQNLIFQLGQSQTDRLPPELGMHFADVDERSREDLLAFAQTLAQFVNYYRNNTDVPVADWQSFFPSNLDFTQLTTRESADISPHLALLLTFLELYQQPQQVLNEIPGRHLSFYYQDVLRLQPRPAVPDVAHVLFELKKRAVPTLITPQTLISAGKDATGVELLYAPLRDTVVNLSQVAAVRSLFIDQAGRGTVRYAPIANSSDGVGGKLPETDPQWSGFGHADLPAAEVGFALAAPVLRLQEGQRQVTVILTLKDRGGLTTAALRDAFDVFITAEKAWFGPQTVSPTVTSDNRLSFELTLTPEAPPIVDYNREIHGYQYSAQAPILQVLLKPDAPNLGYLDLRGIELEQAQVKVSVSQVHSLTAENDNGLLKPTKAFFPFGLEPAKGSTFRVGYGEALHKKLSRLSLVLEWADLPASGFSSHYANYGKSVSNTGFTASVSFQDGGRWQVVNHSVSLFNSSNGVVRRTLTFTPAGSSVSSPVSPAKQIYALNQAGSVWSQVAVNQFVLKQPILGSFKAVTTEPEPGLITFTLDQDFLHRTYRRKSTEDMLNYSNDVVQASLIEDKAPPSSSPALLNEPYTPKLQSISLAYDAYSEAVPLSTNRLEDFANPDVQFFHLAYFGQRREHRYQRGQFSFLTRLGVTLVPTYPHAGELLVGLSGLQPQDSVSLLFQVAEGSANPDRSPEDLTWFALCDNYWKPLGTGEVVLDTTNQLRTSGIIQFVIPPEATLVNTTFPSEASGPEGQRIWLKAAIANHVDAVSQLITIAANAVAVRFVDRGNDPNHLQTPLEPGRLTKVKGGLATVKAVSQPFASFNNEPKETDGAFHSRVAERLRHKHRAITPWDYERLVLNRFKNIHKVKVIPHAREGQWLAPGHVLIVVVPDLTNQNALDPLQPKIDLNTLTQVHDYLQQLTGMQVQLQVKNPRYQKIQADFKVRFRPGYDVNFYSTALNQALIDYLSPWLKAAQADISFGGRVYKSVLLDFVEELDYVDYLTEFKLYSYSGDSPAFRDLDRVEPTTPDTILVSESFHRITPIVPA